MIVDLFVGNVKMIFWVKKRYPQITQIAQNVNNYEEAGGKYTVNESIP